MTVIKVRASQFSGTSKVFSRDQDGLGAILRSIVIDSARTKLYAASLSAITDNSTGIAALPNIVAQPIPAMNALSGSNGASYAALNTSLGKIRNGTAVLVAALNVVFSYLNLPRLSYSEGTVATPYTIPAQDTSATTAAIASAVDYESGVAAMKVVAQNFDVLSTAMNEALRALGEKKLVESLGQSAPSFTVLQVVPAVASSATSLQSMLATDVGTWLTAVAADFATMAAAWNQQIVGDYIALTDSTGGTAAGALAANPVPSAVPGAATTSAPKAGFDTQLGVIKNAIASMAKAYNEAAYTMAGKLPMLNDLSTGTASGTLAAISSSLTAVDGSSGTSAVDQATALTEMGVIDNALSSLGSAVTKLAVDLDVNPLGADALGGTVSTTLSVIAATAAGVGGTVSNVTLLNTAVNTWLAGTKNNISSIAAVLNACATELGLHPLHVVAG